MDARLAAELGLHRLDAHAVGLDAAVAAAFADALVDDDDLDRLLGLAAAARAAQLGRALLVVHQHRRARRRGQRALRLVEPVAVPDLGAAGQAHAAVVVSRSSVVTMTFLTPLASRSDTMSATGSAPMISWPPVIDVCALRSTLNVMLASVAGAVADREAARVRVRAVAHVLEDVLGVGERRHADPLRAFGAHVRAHHDVAVHPHRHRVAADAGRDDAAVGCGGPLVAFMKPSAMQEVIHTCVIFLK